MRRVIGMDIHRTFGEVVFWEAGRLRHAGRIDMTRTALEGFGKSLLATDEVVIEATSNRMAVSRVLSPFVKRVVIANPVPGQWTVLVNGFTIQQHGRPSGHDDNDLFTLEITADGRRLKVNK